MHAERASEPHPSDPERNALGRWRAGNTGAVEHGAYLDRTITALKAEDVRRILADRGYDEVEHPPSHTFRLIVQKFAGACIVLESLEQFIGNQPVSAKGRTKRALPVYLATLDRVVRLAALVGLDRVPRQLDESPSAWLQRLADERRRVEQQQAEQQAEQGAGLADPPTD
jgi:hypothetical protein